MGVDLKTSVTHPMAQAANLLAHVAVLCYWLVAMIISLSYGVHFSKTIAQRWLYACLSGWVFTCFVLELVKIALATILELSMLGQRQGMEDQTAARDRAAQKRAVKHKQMQA